MVRKVFFSFHYVPDNWRAAKIRQAGVLEGNRPVLDNAWEAVTRGGEPAIKRWIDVQMADKSCLVVLIGSATAGRKWISYEIEHAWNSGKGVVGVYIHAIHDRHQRTAPKGSNPFDHVSVDVMSPFGVRSSRQLSKIVDAHDVSRAGSQATYAHITMNLDRWVEDAIALRKRYR